jgi:glycosyltransferase involved in cell wall biosynthesis
MKTDFIAYCTEISQADLLPVTPVVSVLMTTYNHEYFLAQAIEGVVKQVTDFPFELIIGEDCSTDNTRQLALSYQRQYPHLIRVLYPDKNMGSKENLVSVLSHCRGEFIAICEGDDYWVDAEKLQKQVGFLRANESYVVCYHNAIVVDENGNTTRESKLSNMHKRDFTSYELIRGAFLLTLSMCFRNVVRKLPEEFFHVLNGDTFLISLLGNYGAGRYMPELKPAVYRQHGGGIWSSLDSRKKIEKRIATYYWIRLYYHRTNPSLADQFFISIIDEIDRGLNISTFVLVKYLIRRIKNNLFKKFK